MAISYLVNYDANGNQDVTLEFDSYNEASISGLRYTDDYHGLQWLTFGSVAIEALSTDDINNGYSGYVKIVAQNRSNDNTNMVFFIEEASTAFSGPGDNSMNMSILLLSNDWMNLWWQSGLISGTYMNNLQYGNTNYYGLNSDAADAIGSASGTATNVTFQSGDGRDYAYFDSSNSYIDLGQSSNMGFGGTDDFTISAWVKPDNISMTAGQIFGSIVTGATSPQKSGIHLFVNQGNLLFWIGGGNVSESTTYALPAEFAGSWNHVIVSRSGTEIKLYVNGSLVTTNTVASVYDIDSGTSWHKYGIGAYNSQGTWYSNYVGGIDEVDVWNRRLSDSEISDYYANTNIVPPATVAIDQDVTAASIGDVLTATVDLQGGNLEYFAWELDGTIVAGGEGSPVVSLTVTEAMSEQPIGVAMRVDGNWVFSLEPYFPVLQSLVGHWSFDNGNAVADVGTDGTATGVDFITDSGRTVASFDASSGEVIDFGDVSALNFGTGDFTLSAWVNFNSISNGSYVSPILYKGMTSQTNPQYSGWTLNAYNGNLQFTVGGNGGYNVASSAISTGQWYHVVGTRSGSVTKLYVNGVEVDSQDAGVTRDVSTSLPFVIGAMKNVTNWYTGILDAMVDDVRAYSKALDASEVATLHTETTVSEEEPAPSGGTVDLTVFSSDSWGDGWNNGSVLITDANGDTVQNFTGPAGGGVKYPAGLTETMTVTGGATYTYSVTPGSYPSEIAMTISDSDGNVLVTLAGTSGTGTFDAPAAPAESSSYDWTHGGQLTNIVKFSRGVDALGNPSYAYAKKEDDNTTTVFLTADITDFAQFSSNATGATGIIGSPVCMGVWFWQTIHGHKHRKCL